MVNEIGHCQIKEDGEALFAPPGAGIEPAQKTEVCWLRTKVLVAILLHDLVDMIVAHLALGIAGEDRRIGNVELGSQRQDDAVRNIGRIGQERTQKPNRTELEGKAQARVLVTTRFQQRAVSVIEMKVKGQLFWGWLSHIAAIPAALLSRQERNGHWLFPFLQVLTDNLYIGIDFC